MNENGYCYYSYYKWNHKHYNLSEYTIDCNTVTNSNVCEDSICYGYCTKIIDEVATRVSCINNDTCTNSTCEGTCRMSRRDNWDILAGEGFEQDNLNTLITNNITTFFGNDDNIENDGKNIIYYNESDQYLRTDNVDTIMTEAFIKELSYSVKNVYESIFKKSLKDFNYEIEEININLITGQHLTSEKVNDYTDIDEVLFTFQLSYKGYYFLEKNIITIGINPKSKEITTIKSNLLALAADGNKENTEIDYDFSLLKETDDIAYHKFYIKTEDGSYHTAIISLERLTGVIEIVKIY